MIPLIGVGIMAGIEVGIIGVMVTTHIGIQAFMVVFITGVLQPLGIWLLWQSLRSYYGYNNYGYYGNNGYYSGHNVSYSASRRGSNYSGTSGNLTRNTYSTSSRRSSSVGARIRLQNIALQEEVVLAGSSPTSTYTTRQYNSNGTRV